MAQTIEVKVYEPQELAPPEGKIEVMGVTDTKFTNNVGQALSWVRAEVDRVLNFVPKDEEEE